jgi:hypothetical protein
VVNSCGICSHLQQRIDSELDQMLCLLLSHQRQLYLAREEPSSSTLCPSQHCSSVCCSYFSINNAPTMFYPLSLSFCSFGLPRSLCIRCLSLATVHFRAHTLVLEHAGTSGNQLSAASATSSCGVLASKGSSAKSATSHSTRSATDWLARYSRGFFAATLAIRPDRRCISLPQSFAML